MKISILGKKWNLKFVNNLANNYGICDHPEEKNKTIGEDEKFKLQEDLEKMVKEFNDEIKKIGEAKEKEITTV
jgi:hypothetical protein